MSRESNEITAAWREAIAFEKSSRERYLAILQKTDDPAIKSLFEYLANEELKHQHLLEDEYQKAFESEM